MKQEMQTTAKQAARTGAGAPGNNGMPSTGHADGLAQAPRSTAVLPPVDVFEDEAGFTVLADMPGVSKDRLTVRVDGDKLVIEGAAATPVGQEMTLIYGEVLNPLYSRSFTLSRELDPTKIDARLTNGVLRLCIPKAEEAKPRRIQVSVN